MCCFYFQVKSDFGPEFGGSMLVSSRSSTIFVWYPIVIYKWTEESRQSVTPTPYSDYKFIIQHVLTLTKTIIK
jgi:hypothetical protein